MYDYTPNRKRDGPAAWLKGFTGYLQADAYGGYDGVFAHDNVTEVACWAHARRKFFDAQDSDARRAAEMLALVGELYAIERELKEACAGANLSFPIGLFPQVAEIVRPYRRRKIDAAKALANLPASNRKNRGTASASEFSAAVAV